LDLVREVVGSNPVAPIVFQKEPFDENVEGLDHCHDERGCSRIKFK
jgi:hypothetical protein